MNQKIKVVIYDSGAGGLSITRQLISRGVYCDLFYLADKAAFPYGKLSEHELLGRAMKLMQHCQAQFAPDLVIVACNTASTLLLPHLRKRWNIPFIGVVPAIKPAAALSQSKTIAVLATEATIQRPYIYELIDEHAKHCHVELLACPNLVALSEEFIRTGVVDAEALHELLRRLFEAHSKVDTLVLACTHFPILKAHIEAFTENLAVRVIDSSDAIVNRFVQLQPNAAIDKAASSPQVTFINTAAERLSHYADYLSEFQCPVTFIEHFADEKKAP
ncbi:glutamate racemase [Agaribacterium sp. ZY112]|uniref:glutamate racemase n=1 Tax=Agaribacterium sp. ZY112 TaxID=3233574 RepID=UPI0035256BBB